MPGYGRATMSISVLALVLTGCSKSAQDMSATGANSAAGADSSASGLPALPAALPMQSGPATSLNTAPPVSALPIRRAVRLARPASPRDAYAYLDRASDIEDEIGDAPPDYDYHDDDGVSPYVWQTNGGDYRYAEPVDGGYRYYYYQPGAQYPYLVRTHDYSYAYVGAALVAVYALSGALLSPDEYGGYRDQASRYFWRGEQLRQASQQREHQGVNAANWAAQRARFSAEQANLAANRAQQAEWQAYHAQNDPSRQPGWQQAYQQRRQVAQQFSGWQSRGFNGSPPPALAPGGFRDAGFRQADQGPRPVANSRPIGPDNHLQGNAGQQGFVGPGSSPAHNGDGRDRPQGGLPMAGRMPNGMTQATGTHEREPAAPHQAQANPGAVEAGAGQQAEIAQQRANARHEAAARQQMIDEARHQREMAAQQELAEREQARLRDAQLEAQRSARRAQLQAMAAQRQAETGMRQAQGHPEALGHEHPRPVPRGEEHAAGSTPIPPEARMPVQRPPEEHRPPPAQRPAEAPRPAEARPPAAHPEAPHPGPAHPEPGHEHDHEHHD